MASAVDSKKPQDGLLEISTASEDKEYSKNKGGFNYLRKDWTVPEVVTTCVMFYEMFGWVSLW